MKLDLRLPIGLMFGIYGAIFVLFGLTSDKAIYERSLGINVNLWWGLVLLAFGAGMLAFAVRARRREFP
ncbi:MAG: hypothetical protein E6K55_15375 [Gemmatimonadetes bacterium]|nr:MAG: hypothetical protein DMD67_17385 [Gemmatimonadota bacterium]TLY46789.1 MAG: hypothetical protein E6K55_15375 [Gemmatimonadota bacterium]